MFTMYYYASPFAKFTCARPDPESEISKSFGWPNKYSAISGSDINTIVTIIDSLREGK